MITNVRPVARQALSEKLIDYAARNRGAKTAILAHLEEQIDEACRSQAHSRIYLEIDVAPTGVEFYTIAGGPRVRVA
jgi:hypothetical protein